MAAPNITDPFFRALYTKIADEIESRANALVSGSALVLGSGAGIDVATTAMQYQKAISYIEALQAVIELGTQLDHDRYGNVKTNNQDDGED